MNVASLNVTKEQALVALKEYRAHRDVYDRRDWEIERIYRAISKGKAVISVQDAIVRGGVDERKRPRLAICEAQALTCVCTRKADEVVYGIAGFDRWGEGTGRIRVRWPGFQWEPGRLEARVPRIPPQYRPKDAALSCYHILWEADWREIPRDPMLLKRIGKDAWVGLAAWDLTDVEISVLRAHEEPRR